MKKILELNTSKGGRRKIRMILLTIHNEGETNLNGISWKEEYVLDNIDTCKGMPICASFLDDDKKIPYDHGFTETVELEDGKSEPLFNNSECVGVIDYAQIEDVDIDGETKRVLVGYGNLFYQRYKAFSDYIKEQVETSEIKSSVEIVGKDGGSIIYDGGYNMQCRYPQIFDFSAIAILSVQEADENCYILEVAQKNKEEKLKMDEKEIKELIHNSIVEAHDKTSEINAQLETANNTISELNSTIEDKDAKISELNATVEQIQRALDDLRKEQEGIWQEREALEKELGELKAKERLGELESAIGEFSEEEQKYAESEINSFREKPMEGDVDVVLNKIYQGIGLASKKASDEARVAEQNAREHQESIDIFAEMNIPQNADFNVDDDIF